MELDVVGAARLGAAADAALDDGTVCLTLDLRGVAFIDSSGVGAILDARRRCLEQGCELRLVPSTDPGPRRVFARLGLEGSLPWSQDEATETAVTVAANGASASAR